MKNKIIANQLVSESQLNEFIERDCKLLTSKDLAKVLNVSEAALRKQRSNNRSLFPFGRLGRRIYYPAELIVKTIHSNLQDSQLR
jgi:NADH/NAD ratio-sensing transcriptional regulator Rex